MRQRNFIRSTDHEGLRKALNDRTKLAAKVFFQRIHLEALQMALSYYISTRRHTSTMLPAARQARTMLDDACEGGRRFCIEVETEDLIGRRAENLVIKR